MGHENNNRNALGVRLRQTRSPREIEGDQVELQRAAVLSEVRMPQTGQKITMSEEFCIGPNRCTSCGGEYGAHEPDCQWVSGPHNWCIEYEIPPLRAIYRAEIDNCTMDEAREVVKREQPMWRIRKLVRK